MDIIISNNSEKPLYEQIKEQIKEAVFKGELKEGEGMPSIRNLANELSVSVLTIRRVYEELEHKGFISIKNLENLRDSKIKIIEEKMQELINKAKQLGITKDELNHIMDILYEYD